MAFPTPVNSQITDAITQTSVGALANAPAMAMGLIYQSMAHSTSILFQNTVQAQQHAAIASQAATNMGVVHLYSAGTMSGASAAGKMARRDTSDLLIALLVALVASRR
jgi:hypothetical protein